MSAQQRSQVQASTPQPVTLAQRERELARPCIAGRISKRFNDTGTELLNSLVYDELSPLPWPNCMY